MKTHSLTSSMIIVYALASVLPVLPASGAAHSLGAPTWSGQTEAHGSENEKKPRPHTVKTRKKKNKKHRAIHDMSGMKKGRQKPAAQPSGPAMPGMDMGKQKPAAQPSEPAMPGMDMGKQKPAAQPSEPTMPGMDMGKQKPAAQPSEPAMPGMQMAKPATQGEMAGMGHGGMNMGQPQSLIEAVVNHGSSGTSAEPNSTPHAMIMTKRGDWMLMLHGVGFLNSNQQSGPRGHDKIFSTNWIMPMAQREVGPGTLTLRAMLSLEPGTVSGREYPELLQVGETAYGKPIVDGQHPHDFFMELAALYDLKLGTNGLLSFYAAPVGDPAMGPTAFPHRASASEDPLAALGHHMEDSTHIADDVMTVGLTYKIARLEVSGFRGREPDEYRWDLDSGRIDSWSTRLSVNPNQNWSSQYSIGRLKSPEQLRPNEDILRMTASVMYNRPFANGNWASTLVWGRNRSLPGGEVANGYLAESTVKLRAHNYFWGRIENVDRTNELLVGQNSEPFGFQEHFLTRVQAYTAGYDREFEVIPHVAAALGGQVTLYGIPSSLNPIYGSHPRGVVLFVRVRPIGNH